MWDDGCEATCVCLDQRTGIYDCIERLDSMIVDDNYFFILYYVLFDNNVLRDTSKFGARRLKGKI